MKRLLILTCSCMLLAACGNKSKATSNTIVDSTATAVTDTIDMHHAENALDYVGTYKGVFPAADCPGLETTLVLKDNHTFTQHYSYIDRNTTFDEKGTYIVKGNLMTLKEDEGGISYYKVEENKIRKLDGDKEEITGDMADYFVLTKQ